MHPFFGRVKGWVKKSYHGSIGFLYRIAMRSSFAMFMTLLIILAGGFFGVYADEIKHAFPFNLRLHIPISAAAFSWTVALLASLMFFVRQRADDKRRDTAQDRLEKQSERLEELIRTLPPEKFLDSFADM